MFEGTRAEADLEKSDRPAAEIHYSLEQVDTALEVLHRLLSETNDDYMKMLNDPSASEKEIVELDEELISLRSKIANLKETRDRLLKESNTDLEGGRAPQE